MLERDAGGVLLTQAIHTLDLLLDLVGPVKRVAALVRTSPLRAIDTEDIACATVEYANGAVGVVDATTTAYPGYAERIEIAGTKGSAQLEGERLVVHRHGGAAIRGRGWLVGRRGWRGSDGVLHEPHRGCVDRLPRRRAARRSAASQRAQRASRARADRHDARLSARTTSARGAGDGLSARHAR